MSSSIPQLLCTLAPDLPQRSPPKGFMHELSVFTHIWPHLRRLLLHILFVHVSLFLSMFATSWWSQGVCVALATTMIPTFQVTKPSKIFLVFVCVLLVRSRYILDLFVSCYDVPIRKTLLRQFVFSATVGNFFHGMTEVTVYVIFMVSARITLCLREIWGMAEDVETNWSVRGLWNHAEIEAGLVECWEKSGKVFDAKIFQVVTMVITEAISFAIAPILLTSRYGKATGAAGQELASASISLKCAVATGMGLFWTRHIYCRLYWYPLHAIETRDSTGWKGLRRSILLLARCGLVEIGVHLYVGGVKVGVNICFRCMSWIWVFWYLFSFRVIQGLLQSGEEHLLKKKTVITAGVLLSFVRCASFFVDAGFLVNVYYTLVS